MAFGKAPAQVEGTEAPSIPRQTMLVLVVTPIEQADAELILEVAKREEAEMVKSVFGMYGSSWSKSSPVGRNLSSDVVVSHWSSNV